MRNLFGLDQAISFTLLTRLSSIFGGIGSVFLVTKHFSSEMQGYYYTFGSLIALQIFFELGLTYAITQFVSHEMAGLSWQKDKTVQGRKSSKKRLQSIIHFSFFWFSMAAIIILVVLIPLGILFFKINSPLSASVHPNMAWTLVVIFTVLILVENAALAILEGCNRVVEVSKIRFFQTFFSVLGLWIGLSNNFELYSMVISTFISSMIGLVLITFKYKNFFIDLYSFKSNLVGTNWKKEIWPFQWKLAISWICGYFIYQSFVPLLFAIRGPAEAGQMGMSLQVIITINSSALVWITTKAPIFGRLIAEKDFNVLDKIFFNSLIKSYYFIILSAFFILAILYFLGKEHSNYSVRFIPLNYFAILVFASVFNHFINASAFYLRAYKKERFMLLSIFMSAFIAGFAAVLIPSLGILGAVLAYSTGVIFIGFPWAIIVFMQIRKRSI